MFARLVVLDGGNVPRSALLAVEGFREPLLCSESSDQLRPILQIWASPSTSPPLTTQYTHSLNVFSVVCSICNMQSTVKW